MRVLGFGTYDTARHPRVGIVLDGLRRHGADVVELNVPLGLSTAERVAMLRRPRLAGRLVFRLVSCWIELARRARRARRAGRFDGVVVGYLGHFDVVLARLLFPRCRIVLDMMVFAGDTARDRGVTRGVRVRLLDRLDGVAMRCADIVMVDTDEHAALVPAAHRHKALVVPVGAPQSWFADGPRASDGPLRAVFYGLFTPLQGTTVIGEALAQLGRNPDVSVTMIGGGQDFDVTRQAAATNPNVEWLPWVEPEDLPSLVAGFDVCLGIFGTTPKARRVVPNKAYQGAAAGCVVVTSDTPPQRRMFGDAARFVPPGDPGALAATLAEMASDRPEVEKLRARSRERALAEFHGARIVEPLLTELASSPGRPSLVE